MEFVRAFLSRVHQNVKESGKPMKPNWFCSLNARVSWWFSLHPIKETLGRGTNACVNSKNENVTFKWGSQLVEQRKTDTPDRHKQTTSETHLLLLKVERIGKELPEAMDIASNFAPFICCTRPGKHTKSELDKSAFYSWLNQRTKLRIEIANC